MKKVFLFLSSAMICAAMVACSGNADKADSQKADSQAVENVEPEANVQEQAAPAVDENARQNAIMDAAQQICNCGDIVNCVNTVIDQSFEQYKNDSDFKAAVKKEAEKCIANKVKDKAVEKGKEVAKEVAKEGLNELGKQLQKK